MRDAFGELIAARGLEVPPLLLRFHSEPPPVGNGFGSVQGGGRGARLLAALAGFPPPMARSRFRLEVMPQGSGHIWQRIYGRHRTRSHLRYDAGRGRALERFGPIELELDAAVRRGALMVSVERVRLFGLPLPRALCPQSASMEFVTPDGQLGFDISASLPGLGLLVRYSGQLPMPELDVRR
jgi:hypothetical protein